MSKLTKGEKVLIRNPGVPVRPCRVVGKTQKLKKVHFAEENSLPEKGGTNDFTSPEFCTLLQLTDEIKKIRSIHGNASTISSGPRYRNLNFSPGEKIFRNLIDLEMPEEKLAGPTKSQPSVHFNLRKDPEPEINEFLTCSLQPEYSFSSHSVLVKKKHETKFDGRSIYYKVKAWDEKLYHI